jgi:hypothetical protein
VPLADETESSNNCFVIGPMGTNQEAGHMPPDLFVGLSLKT